MSLVDDFSEWLRSLVPIKQLADEFKFSEKAVKAWTKEGLPFMAAGNRYIFDPVEVKKWLYRKHREKFPDFESGCRCKDKS